MTDFSKTYFPGESRFLYKNRLIKAIYAWYDNKINIFWSFKYSPFKAESSVWVPEAKPQEIGFSDLGPVPQPGVLPDGLLVRYQSN